MKAYMRTFWIFFLISATILVACRLRRREQSINFDYDVSVIGTGMGGLSAGVHLARNGFRVLLLEQHHKVGGCTSSFSRGDFNFDASLHEMSGGGGRGALAELLREAGVYEKVEFIRIPELYRSIFPATDFTCPVEFEEARQAFIRKWPEEGSGINDFMNLTQRLNSDMSELRNIFSAGPVRSFFKKIGIPFRQRDLFKNRNKSLQDILNSRIRDEELKSALSQLWIFYGPPPSRLWGPFFMLANYSYWTEGAWHIKGSSQALSDAYAERIRELGGTILVGTLVESILTEKGRVTGVQTEFGDIYRSKYVISTADPYQTFLELLGREKTPGSILEKLEKLKPGNSLVCVYLGLDVEPDFWNINEYEVFYNASYDEDSMYENMMSGNYEKGMIALAFYGNLGDDWYAPEGSSVLTLTSYSDIKAWPADRKSYLEMKNRIARKLIETAESILPGLQEHVVVKEIMTPRTLQNFTLQKNGIPYGWEFTADQYIRLFNDTPVPGLYLAGSWVYPSHGVSGAQFSGYITTQLILKNEGMN